MFVPECAQAGQLLKRCESRLAGQGMGEIQARLGVTIFWYTIRAIFDQSRSENTVPECVKIPVLYFHVIMTEL